MMTASVAQLLDEYKSHRAGAESGTFEQAHFDAWIDEEPSRRALHRMWGVVLKSVTHEAESWGRVCSVDEIESRVRLTLEDLSEADLRAGEGLTGKDFERVYRAVASRRAAPEALHATLAEMGLEDAWSRVEEGFATAREELGPCLESLSPGELERCCLESWHRRVGHEIVRSPYGGAPVRHSFLAPEIAMTLGEVNRLARMTPTELAQIRLPEVAEKLCRPGGALARESSFLRVEAAVQMIMRCGRLWDLPADASQHLTVQCVADIIDSLERLQEIAAPRRSKFARINLPGGTSYLPGVSGLIARTELCGEDRRPELLEEIYRRGWSTGHATTTSPRGKFVSCMRDIVQRKGPTELLVVMASSSDGDDRRVAGISGLTPAEVHEKMIRDNSFTVLCDVVQSPHFTATHAYSMVESDLPNALGAVMLKGRVAMGIRVAAADKAVRHPGVRARHVLEFLSTHGADPAVPRRLWTEFLRELRGRRIRAEEDGNEAAIRRTTEDVETISRLIRQDLIRPYVREVERARVGGWRQRLKAQEWVEEHGWLVDAEILGFAAEGCTEGADVLELLDYSRRGGLPITRELTVRGMRHPEPKVRAMAMQLLPQVDERAVSEMVAFLAQRATEDRAAVQADVVQRILEPDFEAITGKARRQNRLKHPHFRAARDVDLSDLVETFVRSYERDPASMHEAFRRLPSAVASRNRLLEVVDTSPSWASENPDPLDTGSVMQADLFGSGDVAPVRAKSGPGQGR